MNERKTMRGHYSLIANRLQQKKYRVVACKIPHFTRSGSKKSEHISSVSSTRSEEAVLVLQNVKTRQKFTYRGSAKQVASLVKIHQRAQKVGVRQGDIVTVPIGTKPGKKGSSTSHAYARIDNTIEVPKGTKPGPTSGTNVSSCRHGSPTKVPHGIKSVRRKESE